WRGARTRHGHRGTAGRQGCDGSAQPCEARARSLMGCTRFRLAVGRRRMAVTPFVFATAQYESGDWDSAPLVPPNIIDTIARYTTIDIAPSGAIVALDSPDLARYPFVYLTGHLPVRFSDAERANVRRWLDRGGFLFVDDHNHDVDGQFHKTVTEELTRSFGAFTRIPSSHPLYRAFFT